MLMNYFNDFQKINESKIICNNCKNNELETTQNKFINVVNVIFIFVHYVNLYIIKSFYY